MNRRNLIKGALGLAAVSVLPPIQAAPVKNRMIPLKAIQEVFDESQDCVWWINSDTTTGRRWFCTSHYDQAKNSVLRTRREIHGDMIPLVPEHSMTLTSEHMFPIEDTRSLRKYVHGGEFKWVNYAPTAENEGTMVV